MKKALKDSPSVIPAGASIQPLRERIYVPAECRQQLRNRHHGPDRVIKRDAVREAGVLSSIDGEGVIQ